VLNGRPHAFPMFFPCYLRVSSTYYHCIFNVFVSILMYSNVFAKYSMYSLYSSCIHVFLCTPMYPCVSSSPSIPSYAIGDSVEPLGVTRLISLGTQKILLIFEKKRKKRAHYKFLGLHFQPLGSTPTTLSRAERQRSETQAT